MWSRKHPCCQNCKTTKKPHMAKGLCRTCYYRAYQDTNSCTIKENKRRWYINAGGPEYVKVKREERHFGGRREEILKRDNYTCTVCGCNEPGLLTVHHKDRKGRGHENPDNGDANLITLCRACHCRIHKPVLFRPNARPKLIRRQV